MNLKASERHRIRIAGWQNGKGLLLADDVLCGRFVWQQTDEKTVFWQLEHLSDQADDEMYCRFVQRISEALIDTVHPLYLQTAIPAALRQRQLLNGHMYYAKGQQLQKAVEPWRFLLPDRAFDAEGYLINQHLTRALPFGFFDSESRGCGWISGWNLLRMNGQEQTMRETAGDLSRWDPTGKLLGQSVGPLLLYLRGRGLPVRMHVAEGRRAEALMNQSTSGIVMYMHSRGAHYAAYRRRSPDHFHFYNAVYGRTDQVLSGEAFLKTYSVLPVMAVLTVSE